MTTSEPRHTLESHEAAMPNCDDPDCEFHHPFAVVPEVRIEECINDIVEHFWENMTNEDELVNEKIEDLAAHLGIDPEEQYAVERYQELFGRIVKAAWVGLMGKISSELAETMDNDLCGDFA